VPWFHQPLRSHQENAKWLDIVEDKDFARSGGLSTPDLVVTMRLTDPHHTVKRLERAPYTSSECFGVSCPQNVSGQFCYFRVCVLCLFGAFSFGEQHAEHERRRHVQEGSGWSYRSPGAAASNSGILPRDRHTNPPRHAQRRQRPGRFSRPQRPLG
jgi:hypothetical protein